MYDDSTVTNGVRSALLEVAIPLFDLPAVRRRISARNAGSASIRFDFRRLSAIAAVCVVVVCGVAASAHAVISSLESRLRAALVAAGAPPGLKLTIVPEKIRIARKPVTVSLDAARRLADFRLQAPVGLPRDIVKHHIVAEPLAVLSNARQSWSSEARQYTFVYERADGRTFSLIADKFSPKNVPVSEDMYEISDRVDGFGQSSTFVTARHEIFVWRNDDQELRAVTSRGLSRSEILHIRQAMGGAELPSSRNRSPRKSTIVYAGPRT